MQIKLTKSLDFKLPMGVLGGCLSADGLSLAAACMDGVYLASLKPDEKGSRATKIGEHESYASSARFVDDDRVVISAGYDGTIRWLDLQQGERRSVKAHDFWSWEMAVSPNQKWIASVTGQYLAGGYKYEPKPESEPSVRLYSADSGELRHSFSHVPSVQAVAFSPDSRFVAAGNLMGETRIWNCDDGELVAKWKTDEFTSWGIIKSHCYLGGIFALEFSADGKQILMAGMGPMRDPMAGNGKQRWQLWQWQDEQANNQPAKLLRQTKDDQAGEGLMETLARHPSKDLFVMGGRLRGGNWNVALFDFATGSRQATLKTGYRVTSAEFSQDGKQLVLVGAQGQPGKLVQGRFPDFGRVEVYQLSG